MKDQFHFLMDAVDDDLLEEAVTPVQKRKILPWISVAVAACLLLMVTLPLFRGQEPGVSASELSELGYRITLPKEAEGIHYALTTKGDIACAQASFVMRDTEFVYQEVKTPDLQLLSATGGEDTRVLSWNVGDVDVQLLTDDAGTSVSWYVQEDQTQWFLSARADSREVLTAVSEILQATGMDVAVAPDEAEQVTYNAFLMDGLTVAETTFRLDGITYTYRMAATMELTEDFADLSGMEGPFEETIASKVHWCGAKVSVNRSGEGKIIWFDVAPGILYSLSMDQGASEEALLEMANWLFVPAQENS